MRLTASALPRAAVCPASIGLAQEDYATVDARAGVVRHDAREQLVLEGRSDELPAGIVALFPQGATVQAELAVAYNWRTDTARILGTGLKRGYVVSEDEIAGTMDLLAYARGEAVVADWKSWRDNDAGAQLMLYALAVARIHALAEVVIAIHYETGRIDTRIVDAVELDAFAIEVRRIVEATRDITAPVVVSSHCRYCPAFAACPAQRDLAKQATGESLWQRVELTSLNDDATASEFYDLWKRVQLLATRMGAKIHARAAERAIAIGDGKVYGAHEKLGTEKLDADLLYDIVRARHGQGIADTAVTRSATKVRLKEALSFAGLKVAPEERAILAELRERGGATRELKQVTEEYRPALPSEVAA